MRIPSLPGFSHATPAAEPAHELATRGTAAPRANDTVAAHAPRQAVRDGKLAKLSPQERRAASLAKKGPVNVQLQGFQDGLNKWDDDHPLDLGKVTQALRLVAEGHDEKLGIGERNRKYSQARTLMREGCGIDQATYNKAKHAIGMQGLADIYDSALTTLGVAPALAAVAGPGADVIGPEAAKAIKYLALWTLTPFSNGAGQIVVDGYQDMVAKFNGIPAFAGDIAGTKKLNVIRQHIGEALKEAATHQAAYEAPGATPQARRQALDKLEACGQKLDTLHNEYRKRVALGQANFVKYQSQIGYKAVTTPAVVAAGVFGGPFASFGAVTAQQALQAPFGYMDEIMLKDHMMRANTKYADVLTDAAKAAGKTRTDPDLQETDLDPAKVRRLWTHPKEIVTANVNAVVADELASRLAALDELDAKIEKTSNTVSLADKVRGKQGARRGPPGSAAAESPALRDLKTKRAHQQAELNNLKTDIVRFKGGQWSELHSGGTIAAMLLSSKEHFMLLTKSKFRRPGEYAAQVLDRHGGLSLPRTVFAAFEDGFNVGPAHPGPGESASAPDGGDAQGTDAEAAAPAVGVTGSSPAAAAMVQTGVLTGNAYANPVTKFTKQRVTRRQLLPKKEEGAALREKKTLTGRTPLKPDLRLQPTIQLSDRQTIDLRETRAWYMQTHSASRAFMEALGETSKSFGTHMKAAVTLPVRSTRASLADGQAKTESARLQTTVSQERYALDLEELQNEARQAATAPTPTVGDGLPNNGLDELADAIDQIGR